MQGPPCKPKYENLTNSELVPWGNDEKNLFRSEIVPEINQEN